MKINKLQKIRVTNALLRKAGSTYRVVSMLMLLLVISFTVKANPIDENAARQVGAQFVNGSLSLRTTANALSLAATYSTDNGTVAFRVFNMENGYVIVAADDCAYPILGYSDEGRLFDVENIPIQLQDILQEYTEQIQYAIENNLVADEKTAEQWNLVKATGKLNNNRDNTQVGPLLTTTWDQGQYYNALCPEDANGPDGHCVTGCVATALAQIINYWEYPTHGRGTHSYESNYGTLSVNFDSVMYDYSNMPDTLSSECTDEEINAVAKLISDCGVAVNMGYGAGESGAYDIEARTALINFFKYSENVSYALKSYFSISEWDNMLRNDISANHPVIYSGNGISGGHLFICDGCKQDDYFHFNFGWSSNGDGWYLTSAINPGTMEYSIGQAAIFGIVPDATENVYIGQVSGSNILTIDEPIDIYHILGHNVYYVNEQYGCQSIVTLVSSDVSQRLVLDIINHEDQNIDIYDGHDMTTLVRQISATSTTNDYSPIVSSGNALTLKYTFNIYSKFPVNGFWLRASIDGDCRMVSNIVTSVDNSTVHLSWSENGNSSEWQVEYGVKGFSHSNGTIINATTNILDVSMPNKFTEYDFYIRSVCGIEEHGPWSPAVCVMTLAPYWTDVVTEQPSGFVVDSGGNITISSAEGLAWLTKVSNGLIGEGGYNQFEGKRIVLESDVDMGAYRWMPIGSSNISFFGEFDGQGHAINNIFIHETSNVGNVGFIASMCNEAVVKNTNLINLYVFGGYNTGGLVGNSSCSSNGEIMNCMVQGRIIGGDNTGGLVGSGMFDITNCATVCDVSGNYIVGNLAGSTSGSIIKNCYSAGRVSFNHSGIGSWIGDIVGYPAYSNVSNCYSLFDFHSAFSLFGYNDVSTIEDNSYFFNYENSFFNSQSGPATLLNPVSFDDAYYSDLLEVLNKGVESINIEGLKTWVADLEQINCGLPLFGEEYIVTCPNVSDVFARNINVGGENAVELSWTENGDAENWQIRYGKQTDAIMQVCDTMFVISTDSNPKILLGLETGSTYLFYVRPVCDETHKGGWSAVYSHVVDKPYWTDIVTSKPSGYSTDSDGNVSISTAEGLAWLISVVNGLNGHAHDDLSGRNVTILQDINIGQYKWKAINGFAGQLDGDNYTIKGLYINELNDNQGFFGEVTNCKIMNICLDSAIVIGRNNVGSLCGMVTNVEIINCNAIDSIYGQSDIGGLVGRIENNCIIDRCYTKCNVTATKDQIGGVVGSVVGGLVIQNCYAEGEVSCYHFTAGGLIGSCDALIEGNNAINNFANVKLNGFAICGGLIGSVRSMYGYGTNITNCYSASEVFAPELYQHTLKASFIGYTYGKIFLNQCFAAEGQNVTLLGEHDGDTTDFRVLNSGFFTCNDTICTLQNPVVIDDVSYNELDAALNAWVTEMADDNYLTWMVDSIGYPVFGPAFVETCPHTEVAVDSLWVDGASIIWSRNEATEWELEYGIQGFCHGDGVLMPLNDTLVTLTELITGTSYDVYVRVICDNETHSRWSDVLTVRPDKKYWKDIVITQPEGYIEDENGDVYIYSAEGMAWLISVCNGFNNAVANYFVGKEVHLMADIDLNEYKWSVIEHFHGVFNGHNHTICGLNVNPNNAWESEHGCMIYYCNTICNANFYNCDIKGKYTSFINDLSGEIRNCGFSGNMNANMFGSVVGYNNGSIINCYSNINVTGEFELAGFVRYNYGNITNCYASGRIISINGQPNCGQFSVYDNNPSNDHLVYWLLDEYNYEQGLFGSYSNQNSAGYVSFSGTSAEWSLNSPVHIGGQNFNTLIDALNAWVEANNTNGEYIHWVADTAMVNGGFPIFEELPSTAITQTSEFANGWNWWSSYVEADDLIDQLKTGLGADGKQIKSQTKFTMNYGTTWMGQLNSIENDQTYMVQALAPCAVELSGTPVNPADHPITLNTGWKWIGFPSSDTLTVTEALAGLTPTAGDQIKAQNSFSTYYNNIGWMGTLKNLTPGKGYMFKLNGASQTLVFPNASRATVVEENITADGNHWVPNIHAYPSNMTVMAVVELDDVELCSEQYELAAFADGECRGSTKLMYVEGLNRWMAFMTIAGDEATELHFGLYDGLTDTECFDSGNVLVYAADAIVGSPDEPMVVRFRGTTGLDEWTSQVQVFPNPVESGQNIRLGLPGGGKVQVEIVNELGVEIRRATSVQSPASIEAPNVPGVYTLRITAEGKGTCYRKLIVK